MPPPILALLSEMMESKMLRVPSSTLKAPPSPVVCAPETVTPEMVKLPPVVTLKMLKLRVELLTFVGSLPLMVSAEAPRPLMVRVPAVPPIIVGRAAAKVMVYGLVPVKLKLMSSLPGLLARVIAASRDPVPEAAVVVT